MGHTGTSFLTNGGSVQLCVASLDGSDVVVDGVTLTTSCSIGLEGNPSSSAVTVAKTSASSAGVIYRGFALDTPQTSSADYTTFILCQKVLISFTGRVTERATWVLNLVLTGLVSRKSPSTRPKRSLRWMKRLPRRLRLVAQKLPMTTR